MKANIQYDRRNGYFHFRSNLEISHSRTDNPKRISRVVFCTSKEYETTVRARGRD
jgi:hypothetical protein